MDSVIKRNLITYLVWSLQKAQNWQKLREYTLLATIWPFDRVVSLQIERKRSNTAMSSFEEKKRAATGNDQAWKVMVTNYYIKDKFCKAGNIDRNLDWFIPSL